jgi:hypothetical protein
MMTSSADVRVSDLVRGKIDRFAPIVEVRFRPTRPGRRM